MDINPTTIFLAAIFTNNMIFSYFLGMCSFISVSNEIPTSLGLGQAVTFVTTATAIINYIIYKYVLLPLHLEYLRFVVFIITIAAFVQLIEMVVERYFPSLYYSLGIFLPLITVNCIVFAVSLFMVIRNYTFLQSVAYAAGSGLGWTLAIVAMAGAKQRIKNNKLPKGLEGPGITLIITGLMALAFVGFSGIVQIQ
ncbi:MAG TPA: NADH:ubiquinone reductase (Na(+)-transporting) subunit E [Tissierellia bacterium]|nr:NADH:ubiquinone reductase (Na(+)-transporting) subunit E [Tissierellia bacterium]